MTLRFFSPGKREATTATSCCVHEQVRSSASTRVIQPTPRSCIPSSSHTAPLDGTQSCASQIPKTHRTLHYRSHSRRRGTMLISCRFAGPSSRPSYAVDGFSNNMPSTSGLQLNSSGSTTSVPISRSSVHRCTAAWRTRSEAVKMWISMSSDRCSSSHPPTSVGRATCSSSFRTQWPSRGTSSASISSSP